MRPDKGSFAGKRRSVILFLTFVLAAIISHQAFADSIEDERIMLKSIKAVKASNGGILVDGILDESAWSGAPEGNGFIQRQPEDGKPSTEETTIRIVYDDKFIYVGVKAFDSLPGKISSMLTRRDENSRSDWINLSFDSYDDKRTAFEFCVNPAGVKIDAFWFDGNIRNVNWNAIWHVATNIEADGWIAEFAIPLSQLRYASNGHTRSWGFQVSRYINRNNETSTWSPYPQDVNQVVSCFGRLEGLQDLPAVNNLEVTPYIVFRGDHNGEPEDDPYLANEWDFSGANNPDYRIGADIKYGLTSDFTVNMTINPDFGQVEQDPSEFNLTAFETYFDEKRPFFVEGSNIFNYTIGFGDMDQERLFYSRRVGRSPHLYTEDAARLNGVDDYFENYPRFSRILGAAKVTGRTSGGWSLGILEAVTAKEDAHIALPGGEEFGVAVEPMTSYTVIRAQKDFNEGRSTFGGIMTNVSRDLPNGDFDFLNSRAITSGIDINHRWHDDDYSIMAKFMGSHISGSPEAMINAQRSYLRYYQRPDASHLGVDSTLTHMEGFSATLWGGKFSGEPWRFGIGFNTRTPGFELNDTGYSNDADNTFGVLWIGYRDYEPGKLVRNWNLNTNLWQGVNYGGDNTGAGGNINGSLRFMNYWGCYAGIGRNGGRQHNGILRGGPSMLVPGRWNSWHGFNTDERKMISFQYNGWGSREDEGAGSTYEMSPSITIRPSSRFNISFRPSYRIVGNNIQYVDCIEEDDGDHYILGHLERKTLSLTTRLDFTLTPNMSLQFYGMPFVTAGRYSDFREVMEPHAPSYADRFSPFAYEDYSDNPDFNFKQFRSNMVFRYEFDPGSTVYFVWSRGATDLEEEYGNFDMGRDIDRLFSAPGDNTFLIKINKWFSI